MSGRPARVVLLGPQGRDPDVGRVLHDLGVRTPVAVISAGWREWEDDDRRIGSALPRGSVNLRLWARAERVWRDDPELTRGHGALQRRVRGLRRIYNLRLYRAMDAWTELLGANTDPVVLDPERDDALEAVRALDERHARRVEELRSAFYREFDPRNRPAVARERAEVVKMLDGRDTVVIEGGHVPVLLNRMHLFGVADLLVGRTVVACSGGAMALAERVVLFHDNPPWGPGHAELGEVGLGVFRGVVPLPHAATRLRLDDPERVGRLARRFAPDRLVPLDAGDRVEWDGAWRFGRARRLTPSGAVEPVEGAA